MKVANTKSLKERMARMKVGQTTKIYTLEERAGAFRNADDLKIRIVTRRFVGKVFGFTVYRVQ